MANERDASTKELIDVANNSINELCKSLESEQSKLEDLETRRHKIELDMKTLKTQLDKENKFFTETFPDTVSQRSTSQNSKLEMQWSSQWTGDEEAPSCSNNHRVGPRSLMLSAAKFKHASSMHPPTMEAQELQDEEIIINNVYVGTHDNDDLQPELACVSMASSLVTIRSAVDQMRSATLLKTNTEDINMHGGTFNNNNNIDNNNNDNQNNNTSNRATNAANHGTIPHHPNNNTEIVQSSAEQIEVESDMDYC